MLTVLRSRRLIVGPLVFVAMACSGGDGGGSEAGPDASSGQSGQDGGTTASQVGQLLEQTHRVPAQATQEAQTALNAAMQAIVEASRLAGGAITTSGRLVQDAPQGPFRLEPAASGPLNVVFYDAEQKRREFAFVYLRLDTVNTTADSILNSNHDLEVDIATPDGQIDVTIRSTRSGRDVDGRLEGKYTDKGTEYQLDLTLDDTTLIREIDTSGTHFKNSTELQGSITAPGLDLTVNQSFAFELITSSGGATFSANTSDTVISHQLTVGDDEYIWDGVQVRRNFRDGTISEADTYWQASGVIRRNGADYGEYKLNAQLLDNDGQGFVYVDLQLPNEVIRLESWGQLQ